MGRHKRLPKNPEGAEQFYGEVWTKATEPERNMGLLLAMTLRGKPMSAELLNPFIERLTALANGEGDEEAMIRIIRVMAADGRVITSGPPNQLALAFACAFSTGSIEDQKEKRLYCTQTEFIRWVRRNFPDCLTANSSSAKSRVFQYAERHGITFRKPTK
jgi:hypothetical protein